MIERQQANVLGGKMTQTDRNKAIEQRLLPVKRRFERRVIRLINYAPHELSSRSEKQLKNDFKILLSHPEIWQHKEFKIPKHEYSELIKNVFFTYLPSACSLDRTEWKKENPSSQQPELYQRLYPTKRGKLYLGGLLAIELFEEYRNIVIGAGTNNSDNSEYNIWKRIFEGWGYAVCYYDCHLMGIPGCTSFEIFRENIKYFTDLEAKHAFNYLKASFVKFKAKQAFKREGLMKKLVEKDSLEELLDKI